jgi:hypothetical protein
LATDPLPGGYSSITRGIGSSPTRFQQCQRDGEAAYAKPSFQMGLVAAAGGI